MTLRFDYIHDGGEIYARSFATIRAESNLSRFTPEQEKIAVRMIHACGMVDLVDDIAWGGDPVAASRAALAKGAPILADARMVASGIIVARLPKTEIVCAIGEEETADQIGRAHV